MRERTMDSLANITDFANTAWEWTLLFLPNLVSAAVIFLVGWMLGGWAGRSVRRMLERAGRLDATVIPVISSIVRYAILIIVFVAALGRLGVPTTSVLAALGAAGLAIGLALQGTLSNIAAGIMLLWLRPFRVGDYIDAEGNAGTVREIGLFATQLDTYDGVYRFVPNSQLWNKAIYNYNRNPARMTNMEIGIGYGADIERARLLMLDLANEDERVAAEPAPSVFVNSLDDSAVTLRFRVWIGTTDYWGTQRYLLEETKRRLDAAGIEIPFPQRVVHIASDEPAGADAATPGDDQTAERPQPVRTRAAAQDTAKGSGRD
ncbi:MAG: mechanosensitive ion channel family protein [Alphaproteobacteria bacterium]